MTKINLDKHIQDRVHGPRVEDLVLYGKVPEYKATNKTEELEMSSAKYIKASEKTYNSPRNIRRLFITHSQIIIQYYMPYIVKGNPKNDTWVTKSIKELDLKNIVENIIRNRAYAINGMEQSTGIELTGTGLSAIVHPYVCSNIEEIYFDYTLLVTNVNSVIVKSEYANIYGKLVNNQSGIESSNLPYEIFSYAVNKSSAENSKVYENNLKGRFPRLRTIAFISNLDAVLNTGQFKRLGRVTDVEESKMTWLAANTPLIAASKSLVYYFNVNTHLRDYFNSIGQEFKADAFNSSLHIDVNIYKFDREFLSELKEKLNKAKEKTRLNTSNDGVITKENKTVTDKSEDEILLDSITEKDGIEVTSRVLRIAVIGMRKIDVDAFFNSMSTEGQKKYKKLV